MSLQEEKELLRAQFRAYREKIKETAYREKSAAICKRAAALPEIQEAHTIHLYWPQTKQCEVDTRPLIQHLQAAGKQIILPRVTALAPGASPEMEHVRFTGEDDLRTNRWGLREPSGSELVAPEALDAIVVPAFGAGRNGHRIGHGRGYYDAFLEPLDVFSVGLVYADCLVGKAPAEPHDVPLDVLVTESAMWRPNA